MKKKLILFIALAVTLCSANVALAGIKVVCRNNTSYTIKFRLTSGWCGKKTIEVTKYSQGTIEMDYVCLFVSVYAETEDRSMSTSRSFSIFPPMTSPQEHHVDYAYEADGVSVKGIQITSPTPGMYE